MMRAWASRRLAGSFLLAALVWGAPPLLAQAACSDPGAAAAVAWRPWECVLEVADGGGFLQGRKGYLTRLRIEYSAPGRTAETGYAAWDGVGEGGRHRFLLRHLFPPGEDGAGSSWSWKAICETPATCGANTVAPALDGSHGAIRVGPPAGGDRLARLGPLEREDRFWTAPGGGKRRWGFLRQAAGGGAFPWVGDSAWAAGMRAEEAEWSSYLADRRARGVTVVQMGLAPAWAGATDLAGNPPFVRVGGCGTREAVSPTPCEVPKVEFWRDFEKKIAMANDQGIYVLLAGLMEGRSEHPAPNGPHNYPAVTEAVNFSHWLAARLGGGYTIFSPSFDSPLIVQKGENLPVAVGKELARVNPRHLITNHWATLELAQTSGLHGESWLGFELFQSGHNNGDLGKITRRAREMAAQVSGSSTPAVSPFGANLKPAINGEGVYDHGGVPEPTFSDERMRQAGYLSWLSGAAGYTFGTGGIWDWGLCGQPAKGNPCGYQMPEGWRKPAEALRKPSAESLRAFADLFASYGQLPLDAAEQGRLRGQERVADAEKAVVARSPSALLAYLPAQDSIEIGLGEGYRRFDPRGALFYDPRRGTFEAPPSPPAECTLPFCPIVNPWNRSDGPGLADRLLLLNARPSRSWAGGEGGRLEVFAGRLVAGEPWGILGRRLDAAGRPVGAPFVVAASPGAMMSSPAAASDGEGNFLVVWQTAADDSRLRGIFARRVSASGEPSGPSFRLSPESPRENVQPAVALDGAGSAVAVWRSMNPATGNGEIWGRTIGRDGATGAPYAIAAGEKIDAAQPKAALSAEGDLTVAFTERGLPAGAEEVRLRHFGKSGLVAENAAPPAQRVNSVEAPRLWLLDLHLDAQGALEVEYEVRFGTRSGGVYAQSFGADRNKAGAERLLAAAFAAP